MTSPFAPPHREQWVGVSPRLRAMRRTYASVLIVAIGGLTSLLLYTKANHVAGAIAMAVTVVLLVWAWLSIGRNFRSWGYTERVDDLLVVHGAMFKKLVVVPYGRMQLVDVTAGPLARVFKIVTVKLHTAAATTDAEVRGLDPGDAASLRDRLTALGEAHAAGL